MWRTGTPATAQKEHEKDGMTPSDDTEAMSLLILDFVLTPNHLRRSDRQEIPRDQASRRRNLPQPPRHRGRPTRQYATLRGPKYALDAGMSPAISLPLPVHPIRPHPRIPDTSIQHVSTRLTIPRGYSQTVAHQYPTSCYRIYRRRATTSSGCCTRVRERCFGGRRRRGGWSRLIVRRMWRRLIRC